MRGLRRHMPVEVHPLPVARGDQRGRGGVRSREDGTNYGFFVVDEDECTRCALCVDRCPTNVITLGKFEGSLAQQAAEAGLLRGAVGGDTGQRDFKNGYTYGVRW